MPTRVETELDRSCHGLGIGRCAEMRGLAEGMKGRGKGHFWILREVSPRGAGLPGKRARDRVGLSKFKNFEKRRDRLESAITDGSHRD